MAQVWLNPSENFFSYDVYNNTQFFNNGTNWGVASARNGTVGTSSGYQGVNNFENALSEPTVVLSGVSATDFVWRSMGPGNTNSQTLALGAFNWVNNNAQDSGVTVGSGSNNQTVIQLLSNGLITNSSPITAGYPSAGIITVAVSNAGLSGTVQLSYTGITATGIGGQPGFTGLSLFGGPSTWVVTTGGQITSQTACVATSSTSTVINVNSTNGFTTSGDLIVFHLNATTINSLSNGVDIGSAAAFQNGTGVININASPGTAGFSQSGYIRVATATGTWVVSYSGLTSTTFTGCRNLSATTGATMATSGAVQQQTTYVFAYTGTTSTSFTGVSQSNVAQYGQSIPPAGTNLNTVSGDFIGQFYNPVGGVVNSLALYVRCGVEPASGPPLASMVLTVKSSLNLFPTITQVISPAFYATLQNAPYPWGGAFVAMNVPLPQNFAATPANLASIVAFIQVPTLNQTSGFQQSILRIAQASLLLGVATNPPSAIPSMPQYQAGLVDTTMPTISWTYSDPDSLPQGTYRIVVFNEADVLASGFNPNLPSPGGTTKIQWFAANGSQNYWGTAPEQLYGVFSTLGNTYFPLPTLPIYDSGDVTSTATSAVIGGQGAGALSAPGISKAANQYAANLPAGWQGLTPPTANAFLGNLQNGQKYRAFVLVTAQGIPGLYNVLSNSGTVTGQSGGINAGMDFTVQQEPLLRPSLNTPSTPGNMASSFDSVAGSIDDLATRARVNILAQTDTDFLSNGVQSVGNWTLDTNNSVGAGSVPPVLGTASGTAGSDFANNVLTVTGYSGAGPSNTTVAVISGSVPVLPGQMLLGQVVPTYQGGMLLSGVFVPYIVFYTSTGSILTTVYGTAGTPGTFTGPCFIACKTPTGAASAALGFMAGSVVHASAAAGVQFHLSVPTLTTNTINLCYDPGNDSGIIWSGSTQPFFAAWNNTDASSNDGIIVQDTGPSNLGGVNAMTTNYASGTTSSLFQATWLPAIVDIDTNTFTCSADIKTNPTAASASQNLNVGMGGLSGSALVSGATFAVTPTFTNYGTHFVGGGLSAEFGLFAASGQSFTGTLEATNFQLERVWTLTDGTFEAFANLTPIPLATSLGHYLGVSASNPGHWWQMANGAIPANWNVGISNSFAHGGTQCLRINATNSTTSVKTVQVEQYFTVSGYTSVIAAFWYKTSLVTSAQAFIQFYDNANTLLSNQSVPGTITSKYVIANISGTQSTFVQASLNITIPATAAYGRIVFTHTNTAGVTETWYIDDVTMTFTGTVANSSPWQDGGWSQGMGGGSQQLVLQRSPDQINWTECRVAPNEAGPVTVAEPTFEADFTDFEYPGQTIAASQTIYYASYMVGSAGVNSPLNVQALTQAFGFVTQNWLLIDPLYGGNVALQVKGEVNFDKMENQTVLQPLSRGKKVVLGDAYTFGPKISFTAQTLTYADYTALDAMLVKTYPLVLRSPEGEMWYVRKTQYQSKRIWQGSYARPYRTYSLVFETVDALP